MVWGALGKKRVSHGSTFSRESRSAQRQSVALAYMHNAECRFIQHHGPSRGIRSALLAHTKKPLGGLVQELDAVRLLGRGARSTGGGGGGGQHEAID